MKPLHITVGINEFVKRQTEGSGKTYSPTLTFEDIAFHGKSQLDIGNYQHGYRAGVVVAEVEKSLCCKFVCPFVKIDKNTKLQAQVVKRQPEEEAYLQVRALNGNPMPTGRVDLILYRKDVLKETNEETTAADWELISFHAIPKGIDTMPMGPVTMMRNQLQLRGGTKAQYTSKAWAESVRFWQTYAALAPANLSNKQNLLPKSVL